MSLKQKVMILEKQAGHKLLSLRRSVNSFLTAGGKTEEDIVNRLKEIKAELKEMQELEQLVGGGSWPFFGGGADSVLFCSGNFYNMINEMNQPVDDAIRLQSSVTIDTNRMYSMSEFQKKMSAVSSDLKAHMEKTNHKCKGSGAKFPSYLYEHYACVKLIEAIVNKVSPAFVYVGKMSWADYFPSFSEASKTLNGLVYPTKELRGVPFATGFTDLPNVPEFVIDAGSSKTKIEVNKSHTPTPTPPKNRKFSSLQNLNDEEVKQLIASIGGRDVPLIATAGIRDFLRKGSDTSRLERTVKTLRDNGIQCVVASGALEAALEHNACKSILVGQDKGKVMSLSMGGQSTQLSDGEKHGSYDNMGAIAIKNMCCSCRSDGACVNTVCEALEGEIAKTLSALV